jgi:hypothetical protein
MTNSTLTRRAFLTLSAAGALAASPLAGRSPAAAAGASTLVYDDFSGVSWLPSPSGLNS